MTKSIWAKKPVNSLSSLAIIKSHKKFFLIKNYLSNLSIIKYNLYN